MEPIKPCPFCKSDEIDIMPVEPNNFCLACKTCGAQGPPSNTQLHAYDMWDKRQ